MQQQPHVHSGSINVQKSPGQINSQKSINFTIFKISYKKNYYILESENGKYQMKSVLFLIILAHYGVGGSRSKLNLQNCENIDGILLDPMLWPVAKSSNNLVHLFNSREIFRKKRCYYTENA